MEHIEREVALELIESAGEWGWMLICDSENVKIPRLSRAQL